MSAPEPLDNVSTTEDQFPRPRFSCNPFLGGFPVLPHAEELCLDTDSRICTEDSPVCPTYPSLITYFDNDLHASRAGSLDVTGESVLPISLEPAVAEPAIAEEGVGGGDN
ncbi:hypothetical protein PGTUg99_008046 [Puccinia graminis f. sp. tritici]|uniref:Uncharacterized protein n=1 Tax=Puccinia graminis f. sp. tritici TaxID=56615 RepID=A0A5B0LIA8_PUCGR|nr:hypothetical protein PGTUg99_008046 [Puccinia graminis f. sp. tritici]